MCIRDRVIALWKEQNSVANVRRVCVGSERCVYTEGSGQGINPFRQMATHAHVTVPTLWPLHSAGRLFKYKQRNAAVLLSNHFLCPIPTLIIVTSLNTVFRNEKTCVFINYYVSVAV